MGEPLYPRERDCLFPNAKPIIGGLSPNRVHCPNKNLNFHIKTEKETSEGEVTVYVWLLVTHIWHRNQTHTVASAPSVTDFVSANSLENKLVTGTGVIITLHKFD